MDPRACIYIESQYNLQETSKEYMWQFSSKVLLELWEKSKDNVHDTPCEASLGIICNQSLEELALAEDFRPEYRCKSKRTEINITLKTCFGKFPKEDNIVFFYFPKCPGKIQKKESILDVFPQT